MTDQIFALDLDWDLINHLALPESVMVLRSEKIRVDLLEDPLAEKVFEWQMAHVREHGQAATASVLEDQFDEIRIEAPQTAVLDLIGRLRSRYGRNKGKEVVRKAADMALDDPTSLGTEMIKEGRRLADLLTPRGEAFGTGDLDRVKDGYAKAVLQGRGPTFGFDELDQQFYGQRGLTFLVGAPKGYKSWFTVNAVIENVMQGKFPYLYSLELPAEETMMRIWCMAAGIPYWKYLKQKLLPEDWHKLEEATKLLDEMGAYRVEKPPQGERSVTRLIEKARMDGADCVFIDQLQYVENNRGIAVGATNDTKDYFSTINDMRDYSDDGPVWIVHQFNRTIMGADKMPDMQQIKASAAVEECGTLVLGLWANTEMRKSSLVQLGTLASRNYGLPAWEAKVDFSASCNLSLIGRVEE